MHYSSSSIRRNKSRKKKLLIIAAVLLFAGAVGYRLTRSEPAPQADNQTVQEEPTAQTSKEDGVIRLTATGDMLPHLTVTQNAKSGGTYDYQQFFKEVKPFLAGKDINFCNQEAPSAGNIAISGYPAFNAPPKFSEDLNAIGCNLISLGNNHSFDKGQAGINGTLDTWAPLKTLALTGVNKTVEDQNKIAYFEVKGVKFSFLAYTICSNIPVPNPYGLNLLSKEMTGRQMPEARKNSDVVIVSTHWCREDVSEEDSTQKEWTQYLSEQGADVIIGTGPHYLQPVKKLPKADGRETIVWYSLGNFLSTQEHINGLMGGIALMEVDISTKKVSLAGFFPTYMHYEWTPQQKASNDLLARKNLMLYPLDQASEPMSRSLHGTSVKEQTDRISQLMNKYTNVPILTSQNFPR